MLDQYSRSILPDINLPKDGVERTVFLHSRDSR